MEQLKNALTAKGIPYEPYQTKLETIGIQFWVEGKHYYFLDTNSENKLRSLLQIIATALND